MKLSLALPKKTPSSLNKRAPSFLNNPGLQLLLFGGKGGCGKTTSAAAVALYLSKTRPQQKILVVSTDPAHSLGDSLNCPLDGRARLVPCAKNLWAQELSAQELDEAFRKKHQETLKRIAEHGTYLDPEDLEGLFSLPLPGLDEVMAILHLIEVLRSRRYDLIVMDTAPTGHTLRLLALPERMGRWHRVFELMHAKERQMVTNLIGSYRRGEADLFLETLKVDLKRVGALLKDPRATEFVPVALPEPMSLLETERLLGSLRQCDIVPRSVILNRIVEGRPGCGLCMSRQESQQSALNSSRESFAAYNLIEVPLFPGEVRGRETLLDYAKSLSRSIRATVASSKAVAAPAPPHALKNNGHAQFYRLLERPRLRFLFFGGKGGVGKTTLASAAALTLARREHSKRILIISTDPAHSLSDSFGCRLGDQPAAIPGIKNLEGLEIDAARRFDAFREKHRSLAQAAFNRLVEGGVDLPFEREIVGELTSLLPPGVDEIMSIAAIVDLIHEGRHDFYVVDTAPTGHLLRFLRLPGLLRRWFQAIGKVLLKHRGSPEMDSLAGEVLDLSRKVRAIQKLFTDNEQAEFVTVVIPEAMAIFETKRLLLELDRLHVSCHHIAVNMRIGAMNCPTCLGRREEQGRYIQEIQSWVRRDRFVSTLPLWPRSIEGLEMLDEVSQALFGEGA